ncbi:hypothetical protein D917_07644 [Trichinella nativa]|uniref:Uncharacterized protein n=1 Tax=Trichinella nativa TaxID=6335 RepID=A0A1Y3EN38_9BILA|nr:hypothetical protein D917_07644 [Trichinella nativa]
MLLHLSTFRPNLRVRGIQYFAVIQVFF